MRHDIVVLIGQIASGKTTVGHRLATELDADFVQIEELPAHVRGDSSSALARCVTGDRAGRSLVFECSGTSESFEELLSELESRARRVEVVKLLCRTTTALDRMRARKPWRPPVSGVSWQGEIRRTETRLRRVPADLTLDTTDVSAADAARRVQELLATPPRAADHRAASRVASVSFSRLALYERCPLAYEFKHVAREPEIFLSAKTLLGELVHRAISRLYEGRERSGGPQLGDLLDRYRDTVARLPPGTGDPGLRTKLEREGVELLTYHYEAVYQHDRLETLRVDHAFSLDLGSGRRIAGQIDRLAQSEAGIPVVIDYKTGSDRESYLSDVPDLLQLEVYGAAVLLERRVEAVEIRRHAVRSGREECYGVTVGDLPRIRLSVARWIRKADRSPYPEAKPGKICEWCAYNPRCPVRSGPPGIGLTLSRGQFERGSPGPS